jgi:hypothetical protein
MLGLERSVDGKRRWQTRLVVVAASAAAITTVAVTATAVVFARRQHDTTVVIERTAPPVVVTVDRQVPAPAIADAPAAPAAPAGPPSRLACPALDLEDKPVGTAVAFPIPIRTYDDQDEALPLSVAASATTPRIAVLAGTTVRVSDDDGATFSRAFKNHDVDEIAVSRDGRLYARAGDLLGVRAISGTESWHSVALAACLDDDACNNRIGVIEDRVVWFHNDQVAVSTDGGRHWKPVSTKDQGWSWNGNGRMLAFRGALYQAYHYHDMCGVDDTPTWRLDRSGRIDHTIFHDYYESGEPALEATDDVATAWRWRERCWGDKAQVLTSCSRRIPTVSSMLRVATLWPVEGARTLAVYNRSLIELCDDGARQIYRSFPFESVDAVDSAGRPLVVHGGQLVRWSPVHGWRRLFAAPAPKRAE